MTGPVAAIDCGTNTIKLLILDGERELEREMRMIRLGQGVDATGRLAPEALERAFDAIEEYAGLIERHGVERIRFVATSATRDAANAAEFTAGVEERLGVAPEVVSGHEEAALAYAGAVGALHREPARPVIVLDVGGGSTELIAGPDDAFSMQIGSVRLHERHLHSDPPTAAEIADCSRDIETALDGCPIDPSTARTLVGVAGTVTQLAAGVLGLTAYSREAIDQAELAVDDVVDLVGRLVAMTVAERRALPWMHPGRADVIAAGGLVVARVLRRAHVSHLVVSESDILDGIARSMND
jgi:exopolyphosphatase / guanosine-5'-triphosphate,3'-diphosphate pyrophosphatase